jgi:hypothetical protein
VQITASFQDWRFSISMLTGAEDPVSFAGRIDQKMLPKTVGACYISVLVDRRQSSFCNKNVSLIKIVTSAT